MHWNWVSAIGIAAILAYIALSNTRMWSRLRRGLRIQTVAVDEALQAARVACDQSGWPWQEPVLIHESPINYWLMTNSRSRGGNCNFVIGMRTARIKRARFAAR
jgi:hypothetical protein